MTKANSRTRSKHHKARTNGRAKALKPASRTKRAHGPSGLDAAAVALKGSKPKRVVELWAAIKVGGLWKPKGSTPAQTLSAALQRDAATKAGRFRRAGRGLWALRRPA